MALTPAEIAAQYSSGAFYYWQGTRALGFYPEVATSQEMRIYYTRIPRQFNLANTVLNKSTSQNPLDDEDELTVPTEQHQAIYDFVMWRALERSESSQLEDARHHRNQYAFAKREYANRDRDPHTFRGDTNQAGLGFGTTKGI